MMRAVTYARVSGDDRGRDGRNLAGQAEMCREYAQTKGYSIVAELAEDDRGASGASFDLPELNNIREMARKSEFDVLVVRELDRLSRNLAKQLVVEEELKRCNVEIEYVLGEYPDTPEGNFMKHVRASVAEFEREKIKERMLRGRILKAKAGKWTGNVIPYGYKRNGKGREAEIEIDEEERKVIRQIVTWFITEKTSLRQIAYRLTEAGITIPGADFNRPGRVWSSVTIRRILDNRSYLGYFRYRDIENHFPELAIITEDEYQFVQEKLKGNRQHQRKRGKEATPGRYLLLDHFFCECGFRMTGRSMHKGAKYIYYKCVRGSYPKHADPCRKPNIRTQVADEIVWTWLEDLMGMDEARLKKGLHAIANKKGDILEEKRARLESIEATITTTEGKIAGLMRTFSDDDSPEVKAILKGEVQTQAKIIRDLKAQHMLLVNDLERAEMTQVKIDSILAFAEQTRHKMKNADWKRKKKLIQALNVRVDLDTSTGEPRLKMSCDLPGSDYVKAIHRTER